MAHYIRHGTLIKRPLGLNPVTKAHVSAARRSMYMLYRRNKIMCFQHSFWNVPAFSFYLVNAKRSCSRARMWTPAWHTSCLNIRHSCSIRTVHNAVDGRRCKNVVVVISSTVVLVIKVVVCRIQQMLMLLPMQKKQQHGHASHASSAAAAVGRCKRISLRLISAQWMPMTTKPLSWPVPAAPFISNIARLKEHCARTKRTWNGLGMVW